MKHAREIGMKWMVGAAVSVVLGTLSSAQFAGHGDERRPGRGLVVGSLENDVRRGPAEAPRPTDLAEREVSLANLELSVRLAGHAEIDPRALIPLPIDLRTVLTLTGGTPGRMAMIEVGRVSALPSHGREIFYGLLFEGSFDASGVFEVVLPPALDLRGLGARGAEPPSRRTAVVELGAAVEQAFASWEELNALPKPRAAGLPGQGQRIPGRRAGHAGQAEINRPAASREVDLGEGVVIVCPAEESPRAEEIRDLARPRGAGNPGGMKELQIARRGGHVR